MKKFFAILAAVGFVLTATAAMAAVSGSPHHYDASTNNPALGVFGMCEVCHIPHAALTKKRIWRTNRAINTSLHTWTASTVGALCATCHNSGPLANAPNTYGCNPQPAATVYNASSHGRSWNVLTATLGDSNAGDPNYNGKPYTAGTNASAVEPGYIECTSCHDPHVWTTRPFLRAGTNAGITGVCADCHTNRYEDTLEAVETANTMHPVNIAYTDSNVNGGATFRATPAAALTGTVNAVNSGAGIDTWPLGGKFEGQPAAPSSTDLIGCGTCHAIHNPPTTTGIGGDQANHLLAIDNTGSTAALCEGCHGNGGSWGATPTSLVGAAGDDHPIDVAAGLSAGAPNISGWFNVATDTTRVERSATSNAFNSWPIGGDDYTTPGNIICTSCHSAHKSGASGPGRLTRNLFDSVDFCSACHDNMSPDGHHSNRYNWPGPGTSVYTSPTAGDGQPGLVCTDCHYGGNAGNGAHNGFGFTFTATQNQYSNLCVMCHFGLTHISQAPFTWPTYTQSIDWTKDPAFPINMPNAHLVGNGAPAIGASTHYIGTFTDNSASINVKRTTWVNGFSKYGNTVSQTVQDLTGTLIICESCHSVRWNADLSSSSSGYNINLLLQNYADDSDFAAGSAVGSGFCVACHNQDYTDAFNTNNGTSTLDTALENRSVAPANMHPMTAWSITKAQDVGRTTGNGTLLETDPGQGSYATAAASMAGGGTIATAGGYVSYPAADKMDCDSCHRPHRASASTGGIGVTHDDTAAGGTGNARPVIIEAGSASGGDNQFDPLCTACHTY